MSYRYTARNQVDAITVAGITQPIVIYTYDLNGNRIKKELGNGTVTNYTYDAENRMLSLDHQKAGISFAKFDYGYDKVDRRRFVKRDNNKGDNYSYDAIDQVINVRYETTNPDTNPTGALTTVNYVYDSSGNRKQVKINGTPVNYTSNNLNEYTKINSNLVLNDTSGNLKSFNGFTYSYDAQNRLTKATKTGIIVEFAYDPLNRCVKRTINGTATFFYYDGWNFIQEKNAADAELARYVHGAQTDEILNKKSAAVFINYHHDGLGNVVRLTNNDGNVAEQYAYDVFGAPAIKNAGGTIIAGSAFGNRFMFTGREYIKELKLYDYRNRIYSDSLGRFFQTDPLRFDAGDYNLYRYVFNNSVNKKDPFGLAQGLSGGADPESREFMNEWQKDMGIDANEFNKNQEDILKEAEKVLGPEGLMEGPMTAKKILKDPTKWVAKKFLEELAKKILGDDPDSGSGGSSDSKSNSNSGTPSNSRSEGSTPPCFILIVYHCDGTATLYIVCR